MAWDTNKAGDIYDLAQWYPRLQVFDDVRGWDTLPYLANEFYLEYGAFDYAVTVPADMLVAGSGALTNPSEVLTRRAAGALGARQGQRQDGGDPHARGGGRDAAGQRGTKTWRFHMDNTRDVAFTASRAFVWDAARDQPAGRQDGHGAVGLSAGERRRGRLEPVDRIYEGRRRAVLQALVPLSLAERDQRGRAGDRHGVSGHRLRRHRRQGQDPVLHLGARDRPQLVPDDRRLRRAPRRLDGRGDQHLHRRL